MSSIKTEKQRKPFKIIVGLLITVIAFWLSFRNLELADIEATIYKIDLFWVGLSVISTLATVYVMGYRMHLLLKENAKIPFNFFFKVNIISQYLNIAIPGRFGELGKSYITSREYPVSGAFVLGTVVIERVFDYLIFLVLWITVPAYFTFQDQVKGYSVSLVIGLVSIICMILIVWKREQFRKLSNKLIVFAPKRFREKLQGVIVRSLDAFSRLRNSGVVVQLIMITIVSYMMQALSNYLLFQAFGFQLSFIEALFVVLVVNVGNAPPSVPGKIGVFEWFVIMALSLFGVAKGDSLSYAIVLHIIAFAPKIVLGFFFMMNQGLSLRKAESEFVKMETEEEAG